MMPCAGVSEALSLAMHSIVIIAGRGRNWISAKELAEILHVSEAHLAKVLQRLAKASLVQSSRGPRGGFILNRDPTHIRLLDVYEAIEGARVNAGCPTGRNSCPFRRCLFGGVLENMNQQFYQYLESQTLDRLLE